MVGVEPADFPARGPLLLGSGGIAAGEAVSAESLAELVVIAVGALQDDEVIRMNLDISKSERRSEPNGNPADVRAAILATRNNSTANVASLESTIEFGPRCMTDREAILVRPASLSLAVSARLDQQRTHAVDVQPVWRRIADAGGVEPVHLR